MRISDWSSDVCSSDLTGGRIETDRLVVSSVDDLALDQDDNRVGALVASVSGPGKRLSFTGETGLVAPGASTVDGGITLTSLNGALTIGGDSDPGNSAPRLTARRHIPFPASVSVPPRCPRPPTT